MKPTITPVQGLLNEQELVLNSIRVDKTRHGRIVDLLQKELNWPAVLQIAEFNKVQPLLYQSLKTLGQAYVPVEVMHHLEQVFQANARRTLRLSLKLLHLMDLLNRHDIESLPFKGPAFAIQAYGDLYLRYFTDLDILVHKRDFPRIYPLLANSGYSPEIPVGIIGPKRLVKLNKDFHFTYQEDVLELHGEVVEGASAYPIDPEIFWRERQSIQLLGREIQVFSPENNLLMVCLQATIDRWDQLKWIADMARLCQASVDMDWLALLERFKRLGFHRMLCLALQLAEEPGGATFTPEVRTSFLTDRSARSLAVEVRGWLAPEAETKRIFGNAGFFLRSRERLNHRLYYILDQIFIPKQVDWTSIPLPDALSPLYYLVRPIRLITKFSWSFFFRHGRASRIQTDQRAAEGKVGG